MSSHYFVKEGQEPALIIGNGASCSYTLLSALLEWSPMIVVLDGAYQRVLDLNIKPDVVIGDFDSIGDVDEIPGIRYIKIEEQESTDLEKGINFLNQEGYTDINLVWTTGNRMDHTLHNIGVLGKYSHIHLVMYDDLNKIYLLPSSFEKHFQKGDHVSLMPLGSVDGVRTSGLKYNLNNEALNLSERTGSSNEVIESGLVKIEHSSGHLVMIESYDESQHG